MAKARTKNALFGLSVAAAAAAVAMASLLLVAATAAPSDPPPENVPVAAAAPDEGGLLLLAEVRLRIRVFLEGFLDGGSPPAPTSTDPPAPTVGLSRFSVAKSTAAEPMETEGEPTDLLVTTDRPLTANEKIMLRVTGTNGDDDPVGRYRLSPRTIDGPTTGTRTMATFSRPDDRWHEPMQKAMVQAHVITRTSSPTFTASSRMIEITTEDDDPLTIQASTPLHSIAPGGSTTLTLTFNTLLRTEIEVRGTGLETVTTVKPADEQTFKVALSVREDTPEGTMRVTIRAAVPETESEIEERIAMRIATFPALRRTSIGLRIYELPLAEKTDKYRLTMTLNRALLSRERIIYEVIPSPGGLPEDYTLSPLLIQGPTSGPQAVLAIVFTAVDDDQHEEKETFTVRATVNEIHYQGSPPRAVVRNKELLLQPLTITNDDALTIEASPPDEIPEGESRTVAVTLNTVLAATVSVSGAAIESATVAKPAGVRTVDIVLRTVAGRHGTHDAAIRAEVPATGARADREFTIEIPAPPLTITPVLLQTDAVIAEGDQHRLPLSLSRPLLSSERITFEAAGGAGATPQDYDLSPRLIEGPTDEAASSGETSELLAVSVFTAVDDGQHEADEVFTVRARAVTSRASTPQAVFDEEVARITVTDNDALTIEAPDSVTVAESESRNIAVTLNTVLAATVSVSGESIESAAVAKPAGVRTVDVVLSVSADAQPGTVRATVSAFVPTTGARAEEELTVEIPPPPALTLTPLSLSTETFISEGGQSGFPLLLSRALGSSEWITFEAVGGADATSSDYALSPQRIEGPTIAPRAATNDEPPDPLRVTPVFSALDDGQHEADEVFTVRARAVTSRASTPTTVFDEEVARITITDNDELTVEASLPYEITEGESRTVAVTLNTLLEAAVRISGTGIEPDSAAKIAGARTVNVELRTIAGRRSTQTVTISAEVPGTGAQAEVIGHVQINPAPPAPLTMQLSAGDTSIAEGESQTLTLTTNRPLLAGETVALEVAGRAAVTSESYNVLPQAVEGPTTGTQTVFAFSVPQDGLHEATTQTFTIQPTYRADGSTTAQRGNTVVIALEDDDVLTIEAPLPYEITEGESRNIAVTLNTLLEAAVRISGTDGIDPDSATKPAGVRTANIELRTITGRRDTQIVTISAEVPGTGAQAEVIGHVQINPAPPAPLTMRLSAGDTSIAEGESQTLTLTTNRPLLAGETVALEVAGRAAVTSESYSVLPQVVEGPTTGTQTVFAFSVPQDGLHEATTQTFTIQPTYRVDGSTTAQRGNTVVTVLEDDDALTIEAPLPNEITEGESRSITVTLNTLLEAAVRISGDAGIEPGTATKPTGARTVNIELRTVAGRRDTQIVTVSAEVPATGAQAEVIGHVEINPAAPVPLTMQLSAGDTSIAEGESQTLTLATNRPLLAGETVALEVAGRAAATSGSYSVSPQAAEGPSTSTQTVFVFSVPQDGLHEATTQTFTIQPTYRADGSTAVQRGNTVVIALEDDDALTIEASLPNEITEGESRTVAVTLNTLLEAAVRISGTGIRVDSATKPTGTRTVDIELRTIAGQLDTQVVIISAEVPETDAQAEVIRYVEINPAAPVPLTMQLSAGDTSIAEGESQTLTLTTNRPLLAGETVALEVTGRAAATSGSYSVSPQAAEGPSTSTQTVFVFSVPQDGLHEATTQTFTIQPTYRADGSTTVQRGNTVVIALEDDDPLTIEASLPNEITEGESRTVAVTLNTLLEAAVRISGTGIRVDSATKPAGTRTVDISLRTIAGQLDTQVVIISAEVPETDAQAEVIRYVEINPAAPVPLTMQLSAGDTSIAEGESQMLTLTTNRPLLAGETVALEVTGRAAATSGSYSVSPQAAEGPSTSTQTVFVFSVPQDGLHEATTQTFTIQPTYRADGSTTVQRGNTVVIALEDDDPLTIEASLPNEITEGESRTVAVTLNTLLEAAVRISGTGIRVDSATKPAGTRTVDISLRTIAGQLDTQVVIISAEVPETDAQAEVIRYVEINPVPPPIVFFPPAPPALQLSAAPTAISEGGSVALTLTVNRALEADESAGVQPTEGRQLLEAESLVEGPAASTRATTVFFAPDDDLHGKTRTLLFRPILIHEVLLGAPPAGDEMMEATTMVGTTSLVWRRWQTNLFEGVEVTITDDDPLVMEAPDSVIVVDGESTTATVTLAFNTDLAVEVTASSWAVRDVAVTKPAGVRTLAVTLAVQSDVRSARPRVRFEARAAATGATASAEVVLEIDRFVVLELSLSGGGTIEEGDSRELQLVLNRPLMPWEGVEFAVAGVEGVAYWPGAEELPGNREVTPAAIVGPTTTTRFSIVFSTSDNDWHEPDKAYAVWAGMDEETSSRNGQPFYDYYGYRSSTATSTSERKVVVTVEDNDPLVVGVTPQAVAAGELTPAEVAFNTMRAVDVTGPDGTVTSLPGEVVWGGSHSFRRAMALAHEKTTAVRVQMRVAAQTRSTADWWNEDRLVEVKLNRAIIQTKRALDTAWLEAGLIETSDVRPVRRTELNPVRHARAIVPVSIREQWDAVLKIDFDYSEWYLYAAPLRIMDPDLPQDYTRPDASRAVLRGLEATLAGLDALIAESLDATKRTVEIELRVPEDADRGEVSVRVPVTGAQATAEVDVLGSSPLTMQLSGESALIAEGESQTLTLATNRPLLAGETVALEVAGAAAAPSESYSVSPQAVEGPTTGTQTVFVFSVPQDGLHEATTQTFTIQPTYRAGGSTTAQRGNTVVIGLEDDDALTVEASLPDEITEGESSTVAVTLNTLLEAAVRISGPDIEPDSATKLAGTRTVDIALSVSEGAQPGTTRMTVSAFVPATEARAEREFTIEISRAAILALTLTPVSLSAETFVSEGERSEFPLLLSRALGSSEWITFEVVGGAGATSSDYALSPQRIEGPTVGPQAATNDEPPDPLRVTPVFSALDDGQHEAPETFTVRAQAHAAIQRASTPTGVVFDAAEARLPPAAGPGASTPTTVLFDGEVARFTVTDNDALTIEASLPDEITEGESRTVAVTLNTLLEAAVRISGTGGIEPDSVTKPAGRRSVRVELRTIAGRRDTQIVTVSAEVSETGAQAEIIGHVEINPAAPVAPAPPALPVLQLSAAPTAINEGESVALTLTVNRALTAVESAGVQPAEGDRLLEAERLVEGPAASTRVTTIFSATDDDLHEATQTLLFRPILIHDVARGAPLPGDEMDSSEIWEEMTVVDTTPVLWQWWQTNLEGVEVTITDDDPLTMEAPGSVTVEDGESVTVTLTFNTDLEAEVTASSWAFRSTSSTGTTTIKPAGVRTLEVPLEVPFGTWPGQPRVQFEAQVAATGATASAEVILEIERAGMLQLSLSGTGTVEEGDSRELQLILGRPLTEWERVEFVVAYADTVRRSPAYWPGMEGIPGARKVTPVAVEGPTTATQVPIVFSTPDNDWHEPDRVYAVLAGLDEDYRRGERPFYYDYYYDFYGYRFSPTATSERKVVVTVEDNDPLVVGVTPAAMIAGEPTPAEVSFNTMWAADVTGPDGTVTSLPGEVVWGSSQSFRDAMVLAREQAAVAREEWVARGWGRTELYRAIQHTKRALDIAWAESGLIESNQIRRVFVVLGNPVRHARDIVPVSIRRQWGAVLKIDFGSSGRYRDPTPLRIMDPDLPQDYTVRDASRAVLLGVEATIAGLDALIAESLDATKRTVEIELRVPEDADRAAVSVRVPATGAQAAAEISVLASVPAPALPPPTMRWSGDDAVIGEGGSHTLTLVTGRRLLADETITFEVANENGAVPWNDSVSPRVIQGPTSGTQTMVGFSSMQDSEHEATTQVSLIHPVYQSAQTTQRGTAARITVVDDDRLLILTPQIFSAVYLEDLWAAFWGTLSYPDGSNTRQHRLVIYVMTTLEVHVSMPQTAAIQEFSAIRPAGGSRIELVARLRDGVTLPPLSEVQVEFYVPATGARETRTFNVATDGGRGPSESGGTPNTPDGTFTPITVQWSGDGAVIGEGGSHALPLTLSRSLTAGEAVRFAVTGEGGAAPGAYRLSLGSLRGPLDGTQFETVFLADDGNDELYQAPQRFLIRANVVRNSSPTSVVFSSEPVAVTVEDDDSLTIDAPDLFSAYFGSTILLPLTLNTESEVEVSAAADGFYPAAVTKPVGTRTLNLPLEHDGTSTRQERITVRVRAQVPGTDVEATAEVTVVSLPPPPTMRLTGGDRVIGEGGAQVLTLVTGRLLQTSETVALEVAGEDGVPPGNYDLLPQGIEGPATDTQAAFVFVAPQDDLHEATTQVFRIQPTYRIRSRATPTRGVATQITVLDDGDPLTAHLPGCDRSYGYHLTKSGCIGKCVTQGVEYRYPLVLNTDLEVHVSMPRTREIEEFSAIKPAGTRTVDLVVKLRDDWTMPFWIYRLPPARVNFHVPVTGASATKAFYVMTDGGRGPLEAGGTPPVRAADTLTPITAQLSEDAVIREGGSHTLSLALSRSLAAGESVRFEVAGEHGARPAAHRLSLSSLRGPLDGTQFKTIFLAPTADDDNLHDETPKKFLIQADVVRNRPPPGVVFSSGSVAITIEDDPLVIEAIEAPTQVGTGESAPATVSLNTRLWTRVTIRGVGLETVTVIKPAGSRAVETVLSVSADAEPGTTRMTVSAFVPATQARAEKELTIEISRSTTLTLTPASLSAETFVSEGERSEFPLTLSRALRNNEWITFEVVGGAGATSSDYDLSPQRIEGPTIGPRAATNDETPDLLRVTPVFSALDDYRHEAPETFTVRAQAHTATQRASTPTGVVFDAATASLPPGASTSTSVVSDTAVLFDEEVARFTVTDNDALTIEAPQLIEIAEGESRVITVTLNTLLAASVSVSEDGVRPVSVTKPAGTRTVDVLLRAVTGQYGTQSATVSAEVSATGARAEATMRVRIIPPRPALELTAGRTAIREGESVTLTLAVNRALEADESAGVQPTEGRRHLEAERLVEGPANPGRVTTTFSAPADGLHGKTRTLLFRPILIHEVLRGAAMPGDEVDSDDMMEETTMVGGVPQRVRWWQANLFEGVEVTVTDNDPLVMEVPSSVTAVDGESATVTLTFNTDLEVEVTASSWVFRSTGSTGTTTIKPTGVRTLEVPLEVPFGTWPGRPRVQFAARVVATGATASAEVALSIERRTPTQVSFSGTAALEEGDSQEFQLRLTRPLTRWERVRFYITDADATGNPRDMPEKLGNRKLTPTTIDGPTSAQISVVFSTSDNSWHEPDNAYAIWARIDRNYYYDDPFFFYRYPPGDDDSSSMAANERKVVVTVEDNDPLTVSVTPPAVVAGEPTTVEVAVNTMWRTNVAGPGAAVALDNEVGWGQSAAFTDAMIPAREKIVAARVQLGARRTQEGTRWFYDMEALLHGAIRDVKWALDTAWAEAGLIRPDEVRRRTESYPAIRHARDIVPASVRRKWDAVLKIKFTYDWRRAFPAQLRIMDPDLPAGNREWDSVRALLLGVEETIAGLDALIAESRDMTVRTIEMELLAPEEAAPRTTIRAWTQATGGQAETPLDVRGADLSSPSMPLLTLSAAAAEIREGESVGVTLALSRALRAGEAVGMTISENGEQREVRRLLSGPASTTQVATIFSSPDDDLHESVQTILLRPVVILEGTDAVESGGGAVRIMVEDNDPLVITVPDPLEIPVGGRKTFPVTLNTDLEANIHIEKTPPEGVYNRDFRFSEGRATKPRGERSVDVTLSTRRYWNGQFRGRIEVRVPGTNTLAERTFGVHITGRSPITVRMKKSGTHHVTGPTEVTVALSRPLKADEYVILEANSWYINRDYGRGYTNTGRGSYQFSGPTDGTEVKFRLGPGTLHDDAYEITLNPRLHVRGAQNQHVPSSGRMILVFDDVIPLRVEVPRSVEIRSGGTKSVRISVNTYMWKTITVSGSAIYPLRYGMTRQSRNFQLRARDGARGTSRVTVRAVTDSGVRAQSTFNLRITP